MVTYGLVVPHFDVTAPASQNSVGERVDSTISIPGGAPFTSVDVPSVVMVSRVPANGRVEAKQRRSQQFEHGGGGPSLGCTRGGIANGRWNIAAVKAADEFGQPTAKALCGLQETESHGVSL